MSADTLERLIDRDYKKHIGHNRIHQILTFLGYAKKKAVKDIRKKKWKRYERRHSLTAVHIDWHYFKGTWVFGVEDDALKYFECDEPIPEPTDYMLMVYPIIKKWHKEIPSVTHVDGSGRLQNIRRNQNALYYDLIKEFGKKSGIPILINTSFNIRGEPIVCTPHDAYKCMVGTGIDYLVIENFLIKRSDNPKDMWDSEVSE